MIGRACGCPGNGLPFPHQHATLCPGFAPNTRPSIHPMPLCVTCGTNDDVSCGGRWAAGVVLVGEDGHRFRNGAGNCAVCGDDALDHEPVPRDTPISLSDVPPQEPDFQPHSDFRNQVGGLPDEETR